MIAIFLRDMRLALRLGGGAAQSLAFFLIAVSLLAMAVGPDGETLSALGPGALWVFALFACLLSLDRLFQSDAEDGSLDQLALTPVSLEGVVIAKIAAHWATTAAPLILFGPLLGVMLRLPPEAAPILALSLAIGGPALSAIGAIGAALTVGVRRGGLLLAVVTPPLYIPTLASGAGAVHQAAIGLDPWPSLAFLAAVTLGALAIAPFAAAAALRVNSG